MWTGQFIRRFMLIWIPLVLLLGTLLWVLHHVEVNALLTINKAEEHHVLQLASQTITTELAMLRGDALYLSELSTLSQWLETANPMNRERLSNDFLSFAEHHGYYDQVRLLDAQGKEIVRIDWKRGQPIITPLSKLQDKSNRYYVSSTLALDQKSVFISPFDLNFEQGVIEQPLKPVIRIATPVYDSQGRKRGLIVLNYLGQRLLNHLREIPNQQGHELWLLNAEGYWLLGPRPEMEWGFMFPDRQAISFKQEHSELWSSLMEGPVYSQFMHKEDLYTYAVGVPENVLGDAQSERWILVAFVPSKVLAAKLAGRTNTFITLL